MIDEATLKDLSDRRAVLDGIHTNLTTKFKGKLVMPYDMRESLKTSAEAIATCIWAQKQHNEGSIPLSITTLMEIEKTLQSANEVIKDIIIAL
jgi:hypothetical protein